MARAALLTLLLPAAIAVHAQQLQHGEYFFDADPGFGNGTPIAFAPAQEVVLQPAISVSGLAPGGHVLGLRMKDSAGNWGLTNRRWFTVTGSVTGGELVQGEYFFDADPGVGSGTPFTFAPAQQVAFTEPFGVAALAPGGHVLGLRMRDAGGHWGLTNRRWFTVTGSATGGDLVQGEYFFDADPGVGNGTPFTFAPAQQVAFTEPFGVAALAPGGHVLGLRMRDTGGHWGLTNRRLFMVQAQTPGGGITAVEHFLDADPGFGQGTVVTAPGSAVIDDLLFEVLTDTLSGGAHTLFVRAWSEHGAVSLSNALPFEVLVGIGEVAVLGITAGPNPMADVLWLQRDGHAAALWMDLLDAQGKRLATQQWTGPRTSVDVTALAPGSYLLVLRSEGRAPVVVKLVKE